MKVLHVVEVANAGVGRHVLDLVEGLRDHDVESVVTYPAAQADSRFLDRLARLGVRGVQFEFDRRKPWTGVSAVRSIRRTLVGRHEIAHGHSSFGGALARLAAYRVARCVYTPNAVRSLDPGLTALGRSAVRITEAILDGITDCTIAVSAPEGAHLHSTVGASHVRVIPNAVGRRPVLGRAAAREALGISAQGKAIGFVGRLARQKRVDRLLAALARIDLPGAELVVVGDGSERAELEALAESLGVRSRVRWLGEVSGSGGGFDLYRAFDVLAIPSDYEGLSYTLLEALAAGVPVVATEGASSGLLETMDSPHLRVVPNDDVVGLASGIRELVSRRAGPDAPEMEPLGPSFEDMIDDTLQVYRSVVAATS